jgi:hypothetical protein
VSFFTTWADNMVSVRKVLRDDGRLIAIAGYCGTNRVLFAAIYPHWAWQRYHNDNREKRA